MEKCPSCSSFNVRKSKRHLERRGPGVHLFRALFRCRDCGRSFEAADTLKIQLTVLTIGMVAVTGMVSAWLTLAQPGAREPAEFGGASELPLTSDSDRRIRDAKESQDDSPGSRAKAETEAQLREGLSLVRQGWADENQETLAMGVSLIRSAADQQLVDAQLLLGSLHEKGRGMLQDYPAAAQWYERAARQGDATGMARLGRMYLVGRGVEKDPVDAYVWLNLAAARGNQDAESDRDRVRKVLTPSELAQAQEQARRRHQSLPLATQPSREPPHGW
ncbi:Sel1 domain protein repeat-containing protein [Thiorhodococcus drewsii AZ1]|uniref:Sel1 domain protein repeat-containing protein n=2 Tax=Thiorhodococcus drewsii TaxID=210408 RepID=G2E607_9GAMM|nr:Sel1 domain protein repeat-containing protein [Thiorhodococcus drewsii AZ1]